MTKLISFSILAASCISAQSAIIAGISAAADSTFNSGVAVGNLVNNSDLSENSFTATHAEDSDSRGQWHTAVGVTGNTNVTFNLNGTYDLQSIYIWNHNQPTLLDRGVNQFDIFVSSNGTNFTEVSSDLNLAISPGGNAISAQTFALAATNITHVRLHIDSNHGSGDVVGLAEVKFDSVVSTVPEPSSAILFAFSGLSLLYRRRRS